jgi:hypothetical protein
MTFKPAKPKAVQEELIVFLLTMNHGKTKVQPELTQCLHAVMAVTNTQLSCTIFVVAVCILKIQAFIMFQCKREYTEDNVSAVLKRVHNYMSDNLWGQYTVRPKSKPMNAKSRNAILKNICRMRWETAYIQRKIFIGNGG